MPHFQLPSYDDEPSPPPYTRSRQQRQSYSPATAAAHGSNTSRHSASSSSCRLVTLSPDGRTVHTLIGTAIQTCRIPDEHVHLTELPDWVQSALAIDAAVELVCVEGEAPSSRGSKTTATTNEEYGHPYHHHCVCLATKKSVYFIQFVIANEKGDAELHGKIISVTEPLERHLELQPSSATILRVRPPPRSVTLAPPGSFAVLVEIKDLCEYILLLHHGADGSISTPLNWAVEDVTEEDSFTDFCFVQSHGLSLLSALSVLLLKSSGDVLAASPIVFDRTVVSRTCTDEVRRYLQQQVDSLERSSAKWRQCRSAMQYFSDVFVGSENRTPFVTAHVLNVGEHSAGNWPLKVLGPILFRSGVDPGPAAIVIEAFGSSDVAAGVAIGRLRGCIDFATVSPTSFVPRFGYESRNDAYDLDDRLVELAALVDRVDLGSTSNERMIQMLGDPVSGTLLHYATPSQVLTVSTNAFTVARRKLKGLRDEAIHTTAWTSLNSSEPIQGVVVPVDATLGHCLVAQLKSGKQEQIDVTASKYLHEFQLRFQQHSQTSLATGMITQIQPFYAEVEPLVQRVNAGLSNMARIVGSETSYKDITPDVLAVALRVKKRCDDEVVMPLLELKKLIEQRQAMIRTTLQHQENQMKTVLQKVNEMKQSLSTVGTKLQLASDNATQLTERSASVLQTSRELLPLITEAEFDYFQDMKRLNLKVTQMEKESRSLVDSIKARCAAVKEMDDVCLNSMMEEKKAKANILLNYGEKMLKSIGERVNTTRERTKALFEQNNDLQ